MGNFTRALSVFVGLVLLVSVKSDTFYFGKNYSKVSLISKKLEFLLIARSEFVRTPTFLINVRMVSGR